MGQKTADSDIRMMVATQVAYLNGSGGMSVGDLVARTISRYGGRTDLSEKETAQLETAEYIKSLIKDNGLQECNRWIIKEVADDNVNSGFYACLIDTRDGEAVLGFRGSETYGEQWVNDWGKADYGLLNSVGTEQQRKAKDFTRFINDKYGDFYRSYNFTGHSLGGNLAEHATVTAPDGMPIGRCLNLDGPGFSDEYIAVHRAEIAQHGQYIDHYQYSAVGSLLFSLPLTNYQTIQANGEGLERHSTSNIEFDADGQAQPGERDVWSVLADAASKGVELSGIDPVLLLICPTLAMLKMLADKGVVILQGMRNLAEETVNSITSVLQTLKDTIDSWFYSLFGTELTGEYEMNISYVYSMGSSMEGIAGKLAGIGSEVSDIAKELRYHSISGAYYKSMIRNIGDSVGRDSKKVSELGKAACDCGQYCANSDMQAAQIYRGIG